MDDSFYLDHLARRSDLHRVTVTAYAGGPYLVRGRCNGTKYRHEGSTLGSACRKALRATEHRFQPPRVLP